MQLKPRLCKVDDLAPKALYMSESTLDELGIVGDVELVRAEQNESSNDTLVENQQL